MRNIRKGTRETRAAAMPAVFAGRYLAECVVAGDSTSVLWRAKEMATEATVALKLFSPEVIEDPAALATAQQIVHATQQVGSPAVVAPTEIVSGGKHAAIVTPWVDGPSLRRMAQARPGRVFEIDDFRRWLAALLDAMEAAHAAGLVHGALSPDLVLQQGGEMRVVGWGMHAWLHRAARRGRRPGADEAGYSYLSPALRRGELPTVADDIYAVGVLVYEMLTGSLPRRAWWSGSPRSLTRQRRKNGIRGATVPVNWERAIRLCLDPRERERVGSVRSLRSRLELNAPKAPVKKPAPVVSTARPAAQAQSSVRVPATEPTRPTAPAPARAAAPVAIPVPPPSQATIDSPEPPIAVAAQRSPGPQETVVRAQSGPAPRMDARAPQRGHEAAHSQPFQPITAPAMTVPAHDLDAREPVPGVTALRTWLVVLALATIGVGAFFAWQIAERTDGFRGLVGELNDAETETDSQTPSTVPERSSRSNSGSVAPDAVAVHPSQRDGPAAGIDRRDRGRVAEDTAPTPRWEVVRETVPTAAQSTPSVTTVSVLDNAVQESGDMDTPSAGHGMSVRTSIEGSEEVEDTVAGNLRLSDELSVVAAAGSPLTGGIYEFDSVEVVPRLLERVDPILPADVVRSPGPERVELVVVIDRMGRVASASIHSTTSEALVAPILRAAKQWRFSPATRRGQPVAVRAAVPLVFESR